MNAYIRDLVLEKLVLLKSHIPSLKDDSDFNVDGVELSGLCGICLNTEILTETSVISRSTILTIRSLSRSWIKFSGDPIYPVPSTISEFDAHEMYSECENKWVGEYGELRIELLDHMITTLQSELLS